MPQPDFSRLLDVFQCKPTVGPVLFEFFLNEDLYRLLAGEKYAGDDTPEQHVATRMWANVAAGYDYAMIQSSQFHFKTKPHESKRTYSLNDGISIYDEASFDRYEWLEPENFPMAPLDAVGPILPDGMGVIVNGPCGVLENLLALMGYDNLCFQLYENPDLVRRVVDNIGSRLLRYYQLALEHPVTGALMVNDDWGFKQQTMISPADMRKLIFPWHKRIVQAAHEAGRPAMLHSCGNASEIWEDIIEDIGFDAKHSFEDTIAPVEDEYERYNGRIALLGGIDLDFVCRSTPEKIRARVHAMIERTQSRGGWAVGSGNSIPYYVPTENYLAMINAARELMD